MASFAQATAYLQPCLEYAAKLSSVIPMWLLLVMADKHFLGLPLLEGSVWRSPRIPPRFFITASRSSVSSRANPHKDGSMDFIPPRPQPSQSPYLIPNSLPVRTSYPTTVGAVSLYQPLEVHDPFNSSSQWLEASSIGCLVLLALMITFLGIITKGRWHPFAKRQLYKTNDIETPTPHPHSRQALTERLEFPIYWEQTPKDIVFAYCETPLEHGLEKSTEKIEETKPDSIDTWENRKEYDESEKKKGDEDGEGDGDSKGDRKDAWKADIKDHSLSESGDILQDDGLDGSPVVGQRTKKKKIRQNAKKRAAKRAAAEEAETKLQEPPNVSFGDAKEHEEEKAMPDEGGSVNWPETALGGAPEENRKKARRRQHRKPKVKDHALNGIDHEPDHQ